ncbi:hypothetical protein P5V78_02105 [Mycobacteroides abscessus subsp. abscessus]|uniref:Uncharacterized protein n=2 Tax=root TaxID=1 RepID=A0A8B4E6H6_9MYCO|nr:hypothetical protein [Mycobacteroides abscessus]YP_010050674.1 hypothetical protein KDJ10_gp51 [Mycobacterium phage phiT46-1]QSM02849.1 hypothetical protein PROPHIGD58-1_19 [Mycobacterium phage prophi58-1]QSM03142.1 hypothetical protein PROPHIGD24-2_16 [Mycobacterium phage prophiGD24-2]QSM03476.1 hypothetical protein PROPHIGD21-3_16 [Mycobacterium phage prophiGD21-3]WJJ56724.1 hypothetical protein PROPHIT461_16 [Mycobacterium phage prophiT46-1]ALM17649.1 hypothetical protein AOY11_16610 [M
MGATTKPKDLKSTNALDDIDDGEPHAYIGFRATNIKINNPPCLKEGGTLLVKYRCIESKVVEAADGEMRDKRTLKVEWVGLPGQKAPAGADENQGSMLDVVDGNPVPSAEATGDESVVDAEVIDDEDDAETGPEFSDEG